MEEDGRRLEGVAGTLRYPMVVSKPPRDLYLTENSSFQSGYNAKLTLIRVLKECHGKSDCLLVRNSLTYNIFLYVTFLFMIYCFLLVYIEHSYDIFF